MTADLLNHVCWHEAGHAIMAYNLGFSKGIIKVFQIEDGDWTGYHASAESYGDSKLDILAAGLAGGLIYIDSLLKARDPIEVEIAFAQADDDRDRYLYIRGESEKNSTFHEWSSKRCVPFLRKNIVYLSNMANELVENKQIGVNVFNCIVNNGKINDQMRILDEKILEKTHEQFLIDKRVSGKF